MEAQTDRAPGSITRKGCCDVHSGALGRAQGLQSCEAAHLRFPKEARLLPSHAAAEVLCMQCMKLP